MWASFSTIFLLSGVTGMIVAQNIDVIGYYGNSGNAVATLTLDEIHPNYNIIVITFASISDSGQWRLDITGPYDGHLDQLAADVTVWKEQIDPWYRDKAALISVGSQNGGWPSGVSLSALLEGLWEFLDEFHLDGLDIDLVGSNVASAGSLLAGVITNLTMSGKLVTAAPEALQGSLTYYAPILPLLSWVQPQFYNNGPNNLMAPYLPPAELWPRPWTVTDWQDEQGGEAFWAGVLDAIADAHGLVSAQKGMLVPASTIAAFSYNDWDMEKLANEVANFGVTHVGTWSIAHDLLTGWAFATAIGDLNGDALYVRAPSIIPTLSPSPMLLLSDTTEMHVSGKIDIIGYYGNSGNAVSTLTLDEIHPNYNILVIEFASFSDSGQWRLDITDPYVGHLDQLAADVSVWKEQIDPWYRRKAALISVGSQNGGWPSGISLSALLEGLWEFLDEFRLDGINIDLVGADVAVAGSLLAGLMKNLTMSGKLVTASPEAAQDSLTHYASILPLLSWVQPQFYNNGPNSVTTPYLPPANFWPSPWTVTDWQDEQGGEAFWAGVLDAIADAHGLVSAQKGMLVPASTIAAFSYNDWDMEKLANEVANSGVTHVGTWSIAHDLLTDWAFATAIGDLNGDVLYSRPVMMPTLSPSPSNKFWSSEAITLGVLGLIFLCLVIAFASQSYVITFIKHCGKSFSTKSTKKELTKKKIGVEQKSSDKKSTNEETGSRWNRKIEMNENYGEVANPFHDNCGDRDKSPSPSETAESDIRNYVFSKSPRGISDIPVAV